MPPPTSQPVESPGRRLREFWAHFDAKDDEALLAMLTDDAIETDDLAHGWLRGHAAIGEHFARRFERWQESQTLLQDVKVTETSAMAVVTCLVRYQMRWDGQPASVDAPTTMIFVREAGCGESRCSTRSSTREDA